MADQGELIETAGPQALASTNPWYYIAYIFATVNNYY